MSSQESKESIPPTSKPQRLSDELIKSLASLASTVKANSGSNSQGGSTVTGYYVPPTGSQYVPHPRTITDVLFRTIFIQLCAALAYALFLQTLKQILHRKGRRISDLPGPYWIWPLLSVVLPELILVQIGLWVICGMCPSIAEGLGIGPKSTSQSRLARRHHSAPDPPPFTFLQAIALVVPLYYAGKAYKERLSMKYHVATFIGNLGLDHRNGWAVVSGLSCGTATILLAILMCVRGRKAMERPPAARRSGNPRHLAAIEEEDENEVWDKEVEKEKDDLSPGSSNKKKDSHGRPRRSSHNSSEPATSRSSTSPTRNSFTALFQDPEAILILVLTTTIHQIPLAATNRMPPLTAALTTKWCLSFIPIILLSFFTLPHSQRLALRRALFSSNGGDRVFALLTLMRSIAVIIPSLLVFSTIILQAWSDLSELRDVGYGIVQPWNYRWQVKDLFSHSDPDRVYMG